MILDRNLAVEYAQVWQMAPQQPDESRAEFRERIACALANAGHHAYAHEALFNDVMTHDPFSRGPLDRGYGIDFIAEVARQTEATLAAGYQEVAESSWFRCFRRLFQ